MGLDMYAYTAAKGGSEDTRELAYWRKHPNLHGWMERLWEHKLNLEGRENPHNFNGIELELTWEDIGQLEKDVNEGKLPTTTGYFFGDPSDEYYKPKDLEFIKNARAELFLGLKVFYNSSW
jgi:hypothetical protein